MKRKGAFLAVLLIFSIIACRPRPESPQRTKEDGVEVVNNGLEPYTVKGEANQLRLENKLIIDFEKADLASVGIPEIAGFDVDSQGFIYVWSYQSPEYFIFKFDPSGGFVRSFGRRGQGPGEIAALENLSLSEKDEVLVSNDGKHQILVMSTVGEIINDVPLPAQKTNMVAMKLLSNGKILAWRQTVRPEGDISDIQVVLCDKELNELAVLGPTEEYRSNLARAKRINGLEIWPTRGSGSTSRGRIFVGNKQSGYQISVYDFDGNPVRRIRKHYRLVAVPRDIKEKVLKAFDEPQKGEQKNKLFFPNAMPPIQFMFTDDQGRLFVMTFEKGDTPGSYMYDIFNPDGVFIGRISLDNSGNESTELWGGPFEARAKNNLLYYLRAKESGFQELVVCRMIWSE